MPLTIVENPLAAHLLTQLRDVNTEPERFRAYCAQLTVILAIEAAKNIRTIERPIQTPMENHAGKKMDERIVVVPILRAGLGMLEPIVDLFPDVSVGYIGLERDHDTAIANSYYCKLPPLTDAFVMLVDPMLATGGSAVNAIKALYQHGAEKVTLICIVSAPEGVDNVLKHFPDIPIVTSALDRELNSQKYILPGLGDFGDRLYGTK